MGHSESINKNVYQCPIAIREITEVGQFLDKIDNSNDQQSLTASSSDNAPNVAKADNVENLNNEYEMVVDTHEAETLPDLCPNDVTSKERRKRSLAKQRSRRYMSWSDADAKKVKSYFKEFVEDYTTSGVKGSLPGKNEIKNFLNHCRIFSQQEVDEITLIDLVKTKVFNERNKYRKEREFISL